MGTDINIDSKDFNRLKTIIRDDKFWKKIDNLISVIGAVKILSIETKQKHNYELVINNSNQIELSLLITPSLIINLIRMINSGS